MTNCPYIIFDQSHCAGCHGWRCTAFGRKKKLSDVSVCQAEEEWVVCPRYLATTTAKPSGIGVLGMPGSTTSGAAPLAVPAPPPPATGCEFMSVAGSRGCCSNMWCDAGNMMLRSTKKCYSPSTMAECRLYVKAKRKEAK